MRESVVVLGTKSNAANHGIGWDTRKRKRAVGPDAGARVRSNSAVHSEVHWSEDALSSVAGTSDKSDTR